MCILLTDNHFYAHNYVYNYKMINSGFFVHLKLLTFSSWCQKPYQCHSDACFIFLAPQVAQPREQRRVWFADGILPNGEVADAAKLTMNGTSSAGTLAVAHDPVKPAATSPLPAEVRK